MEGLDEGNRSSDIISSLFNSEVWEGRDGDQSHDGGDTPASRHLEAKCWS